MDQREFSYGESKIIENSYVSSSKNIGKHHLKNY